MKDSLQSVPEDHPIDLDSGGRGSGGTDSAQSTNRVSVLHFLYCIQLKFGVLKFWLYSPAGGYLCYFKFAHSSTQTKSHIYLISI